MSRSAEDSPSAKGKWVLTEEAFEKLLGCLDSNREEAGIKYSALHLRLSEFFRHRQCIRYLELADETLNRLARSLTERAIPVDQINAFCFGIARNIVLEAYRKQARESPGTDAIEVIKSPPVTEPFDSPSEIRIKCFDECLHKSLSPAERQLIIDYYELKGRAKIDHRQVIADQQGCSKNALRVRACRLREKLESCIKSCCDR
jgi:DNA-directed RNA polymerase specialized sigma24 family protein